jgi:hypothetical protein
LHDAADAANAADAGPLDVRQRFSFAENFKLQPLFATGFRRAVLRKHQSTQVFPKAAS